jgi:hypothetical protein
VVVMNDGVVAELVRSIENAKQQTVATLKLLDKKAKYTSPWYIWK